MGTFKGLKGLNSREDVHKIIEGIAPKELSELAKIEDIQLKDAVYAIKIIERYCPKRIVRTSKN